MKRLVPIFSFLILLLFSTFVLAAEIRGIVVDAKTGEPLPGVNVVVKGQTVGAATDEDGFFQLEYSGSNSYTLVFSYIGYKTAEVTISPGKSTSNLKVAMNEDVFKSEEVVVTGIASRTSKARAEVAVANVNAAKLSEQNVYTDFSQLISAKVPGLTLQRSSGQVGSGYRFYVRSGGGLNGNEQPVIYVDGVRVDNTQLTGGTYTGGQGVNTLADLNPEDIAKVQVLKGPAAAATYGTNGSNGVILITTKRGQLSSSQKGGISITYKNVFGQNQQAHDYTTSNFLSANDANAIFRDGNIWEQYITASGGNNFLRYYTSFNRRIEEGILRNNELDRKTVKANFDAFPSEKVTLHVNTSFTLSETGRPTNDNDIFGYLGNTLLFSRSYVFTDSASVEGIRDKWRNNRFVGSIHASYNPIKNLEIRGGVGVDNFTTREDNTFPADLPFAFFSAGDRRIFNRTINQYTWDINGRYNYSLTNDLKATTVVGAQLFENFEKTSFLEAEKFVSALITDIGTGEQVTDKGEGQANTRQAGIFAEQQLSFQDRFFVTGAIRRDYASAIGRKAPNIWYPKGSFAVRLDKFSFFPSTFSLFKVRFAYGETGQLPGLTQVIPLLYRGENSGYGGGAVLSSIGNEKLKPERIKEVEVGFDSEFLNRFSLGFTFYHQTASNSIVGRRLAPSTGKTASSVPFNVGRITGNGVEVELQASVLRGRNFGVDLNFSTAYQNNEVKDLGGAQPIFDGFDVNVIKEGLRKHEFYVQKVVGANFDANGVYTGPKLSDGRVDMGTPVPKVTGAISLNIRVFRDFTISTMGEWATGHKIYNATKIFAERFGNVPKWNDLNQKLGTLTPGTPEYIDTANKIAHMDWRVDGNFIESGDFFKLREISFTYSFRHLLPLFNADRYVKDIKVGFSLYNWFTATNYTGADPEVNWAGSRSLSRGQDFLTLQNPKSFNFFFRFSL